MSMARIVVLAAVFALSGCGRTTDRLRVAAAPVCASPGEPLPPLPAPRFADGPTISAEGIREDLAAWMIGMASLNPDLSVRTDFDGMNRELGAVRAAIARPMSRREAWLLLARVNPHLRDGHSGVMMPDLAGMMEVHLSQGGRLIPVEFRLDGAGVPRATAAPTGVPARGDRIVAINGVPMTEIVAQLVARVPGDTRRSREAYVSHRFPALYWWVFGDTGDYDITFADATGCERTARLTGATRAPTSLQVQPNPAELFQHRTIGEDIGYFRVATFDFSQRDALAAAATAAFDDFKARSVRAVIIDVRDNTGGDDPLWQQSLMNNITITPYAQLSRYALRVTKQNADPGDVIGSVQRSDYTRRFTPDAENPRRFAGPVYVLAGPLSYSAAIQFLVAAQDFHIARIAGEETAALSCQTGQVNPIAMPATGLRAFTPIIAYVRPSGRGCERGVIPDVPVAIDEVNPDRTLSALVDHVRTELRSAKNDAAGRRR
ncbi:MAG TPA: S41 family peptidase [Gemmatimonadaceae bacterium]|nr:S41 family peptidase [Gemmatimonadaceae bacterium]